MVDNITKHNMNHYSDVKLLNTDMTTCSTWKVRFWLGTVKKIWQC